MKNRIKITIAVVTIIVGMVIYKLNYDKKKQQERTSRIRTRSRSCDLPN